MTDIGRKHSIPVRVAPGRANRRTTGSAGARVTGSRRPRTDTRAPVPTIRSSGCSSRSSSGTCSDPGGKNWPPPGLPSRPGLAVCRQERGNRFRTRRIADSSRARGRPCRVHSHDRNHSSERIPAPGLEPPRSRGPSKAPPPHIATWLPRGSGARLTCHGLEAAAGNEAPIRASGNGLHRQAAYRKAFARAMQTHAPRSLFGFTCSSVMTGKRRRSRVGAPPLPSDPIRPRLNPRTRFAGTRAMYGHPGRARPPPATAAAGCRSPAATGRRSPAGRHTFRRSTRSLP